VGAGFFELSFAFGIDQSGCHIRKRIRRIAARGMTLGLDKDSPTRFETSKRIVQTTGYGDQFGWYGTVEVRTSKSCGALERAVFIKDDALIDEGCPRQKVGETGIRAAVFGEIHHGETSCIEMAGNAEVSANDLDKVRIALGGPDSGHVADEPEEKACDPKAQTDAEGCGERSVDDGDRTRRAAHEDRLC
jgi:hypothetical protein